MTLAWLQLISLLVGIGCLLPIFVPEIRAPLYAERNTLAGVDQIVRPPLNISGRSFRLALLKAGALNRPLQLELHTHELLYAPAYEALSYAWGPPKPTKRAQIGDKNVEIRENLWNALQHIRQPQEDRWLWIDAICINQNDDDEKSHQIGIMAAIYRRAFLVRAWLGVARGVSDNDFHEVRRMVHDFESGSGTDFSAILRRNEWWCATLFFEPYWQRLWVIQEMVVGKRLTVQFGRHELDFADIYHLWLTLKQRVPGLTTLSESIPAVWSLRQNRYADLNRFRLVNLMEEFKDSHCFDPRDKIYGLLGIASDVPAGSISVNYTNSIFQVYKDVMVFYNRTDGRHGDPTIDIMRTASLTRRILSRNWHKATIDAYQKDTWSSWYKDLCSNSQAEFWRNECMKLILVAVIADIADLARRWVWPHSNRLEYQQWLYSGVEEANEWDVDYTAQAYDTTGGFVVRGRIIGAVAPTEVLDLEIAGVANAETFYHSLLNSGPFAQVRRSSLEIALRVLMDLLTTPATTWITLRDIRNTAFFSSTAAGENMLFHIEPVPASPTTMYLWGGGVLAVGDAGFMGVVPKGTRYGDLICQFYGSRGAAIVQRLEDGAYKIVGRAGVVSGTDGSSARENLWDLPMDPELFKDGRDDVIQLRMNLRMLTALSLNSLFF